MTEQSEPNAIQQQATRWAIRLDAGPLSQEEQSAFDTWIGSDRRHQGAFVRARSAWLDADRLAALAGTTGTHTETQAPKPHRSAARNGSRLSLALAATALFAIAAGIGSYLHLTRGQTYASEIGEVRNISLPDGSELTLNTNTRAKVRYDQGQRDIALDKGEALFKVAHNPARPFVVHARDVQIRAVGTAFRVRTDESGVDVVVTEGTVELSSDGSLRPQRVTAGHRATLAASGGRVDVEPISPDAVDRELAWREGMVAFAGEPLSAAVAEINRHSRRQIYIDDPTLGTQPVVGIFHANDAEGFATAASATFDAEVVHEDNGLHLKTRTQPSARD